jgi:hypothetical protein
MNQRKSLTINNLDGGPAKRLNINNLHQLLQYHTRRILSRGFLKKFFLLALALAPDILLLMKTMNSHLNNLNILCEMGFAPTENVDVYSKQHGPARVRVIFFEFGLVTVESISGPNRRSKIWHLKNFFEALNLLEQLGVK